MIKYIYKLFKRKLNSFVFENEVIHGNFFDKCEVYYIDRNGAKYYKPINLFDLPHQRNQYLQGLLKKLEMGFNTKDYNLFIDEFKKNHELIITGDDKVKGKALAKIGSYINELDARQQIQIEPTLLLEFMAVILIREDENIEEIDHKVIDLKVEQFQKDDKLRDSIFFFNSGLTSLISFSENLEANWSEFIESQIQEATMMTKIFDTVMKK